MSSRRERIFQAQKRSCRRRVAAFKGGAAALVDGFTRRFRALVKQDCTEAWTGTIQDGPGDHFPFTYREGRIRPSLVTLISGVFKGFNCQRAQKIHTDVRHTPSSSLPLFQFQPGSVSRRGEISASIRSGKTSRRRADPARSAGLISRARDRRERALGGRAREGRKNSGPGGDRWNPGQSAPGRRYRRQCWPNEELSEVVGAH